MIDVIEKLLSKATADGASYSDVRYQIVHSSSITVENGLLRGFETNRMAGIGIRVIVNKSLGLASSTIIEPAVLNDKLTQAIKMAKAAKKRAETTILSNTKPAKATVKSPYTKKADAISNEEKIEITLDCNKTAMLDDVKNSVTRLAWFNEERHLMSSEGADVNVETMMTGLSQSSVASHNGTMEHVSDRESKCSGFEFILSTDLRKFARENSELAIKAAKARMPSAGVYKTIADSDLIGLILHEAFGHASEGDLVITKESILDGKLGQQVASPIVNIVDDGEVNDGYFLPYDDEGVKKTRQIIVQDGILKGFLQSRQTAHKMKMPTTGNARAQSFGNQPIVRQTNFFMEKGDHSFEELIEDVDEGLYICGKGSGGGEVDVGLGTFTFRCGPSYVINKGEIKQVVRGISISGVVLETLKNISAVGKDFNVLTDIFGGCGKDGQMVRVGYGGPHVRIEKISVGGE